MKLKHRLSIYSVILFGIIVLIVSAVVYFSFYAIMEKKELQSLQNKTLIAAIYYLEEDELSTLEHENIANQLHRAVSRKNIIVYDSMNRFYNGHMEEDTQISDNFIERIRQNEVSSLSTQSYFYNGIFYKDNQGDFVVIVREPKNEFNELMKSLLHILILVSIIGLLFVYLFSNYLVYIRISIWNN